MRVFRFFESLLEPTAIPPQGPPPAGLAAFYWHYARQARGLVAALFVTGFIVALIDTTIPVFVGRVITMVSSREPGALLRDSWPPLLGMAFVVLVARPLAMLLQNMITNQAIIPGLSNLIRWQSHWHVVRQSWSFFQNDFAGRIAQRVMQTGPSLRESVVDSYTNIATVKLFARPRDEDEFVRAAMDDLTEAHRQQVRLTTLLNLCLAVLNAAMVVGTGGLAIWLWNDGRIAVGTVAMALPLTWHIAAIAGWVAQNVTTIFENIGVVQEGMRSIAVPRQMPDRPGAVALQVERGTVRFEDVRFGYGTARGVLHGIDLTVMPGERVGLVGRSGAGKSTLVNLLLRFYDIEAGRILIDGQDIALVTQESLRAHIAMVTQDTSLLHRSIRDNIRYGRLQASEWEVRRAAAQAHALEFVEELEDWYGRRGFDAHVGERGVKLSGGQRQRIALARVILKDAPILVLDEATSSLDSEVEAAIQEQLDSLMRGRTVIAIAHRLSTIARMDRLIVLDQGRIVEEGTHAQLLARGGTYARLWQHQSGGFQDLGATIPLDAAE